MENSDGEARDPGWSFARFDGRSTTSLLCHSCFPCCLPCRSLTNQLLHTLNQTNYACTVGVRLEHASTTWVVSSTVKFFGPSISVSVSQITEALRETLATIEADQFLSMQLNNGMREQRVPLELISTDTPGCAPRLAISVLRFPLRI